MFTKLVKCVKLMAAAVVLLLPAMEAADNYEQSRVVKGSSISLKFRGVPDAAVVDGEYIVDADDGKIKLPYINDERVSVVGLTARGVEDRLERIYKERGIYSHPHITARVGEAGIEDGLKNRYVQVTGYVAGKKNLRYRPGMTLIEALLECGDITDYGSRQIQVTRAGQTRTYDYFSTKDRSIQLRSGDVIFVPKRGITERRPDKMKD